MSLQVTSNFRQALAENISAKTYQHSHKIKGVGRDFVHMLPSVGSVVSLFYVIMLGIIP